MQESDTLPSNTRNTRRSVELSPGMSKLVAVSLLLCLTTREAYRYYDRHLKSLEHLHQAGQGRWLALVDNFQTGAVLLVAAQMFFVILVYQFGRNKIALGSIVELLKPTSRKSLVVGFLTGIGLYLLDLPVFWLFDFKANSSAAQLLNDPFSLKSVGMLILFIGIAPLATEIGFRGVIVHAALEMSNAAVVIAWTSLLFAYVASWAIFNPGTTVLLGVATALLYGHYRQLLPCLVANATLTTLFVLSLVLKELYSF